MKRLVLLLLVLAQDDYDTLLERLRKDSPGEYEKVRQLDRDNALRFLRERYGKELPKSDKKAADPKILPARIERFEKFDAVTVGDVTIDLCRRDDGAFGLGAIRQGTLSLRRADFLVTWKIDGKFPAFEKRDGRVVTLRDPKATLTFSPEKRTCAGTTFTGWRVELSTEKGPIVETSSWEPGGTAKGLTYFDGYRGWHAPPGWVKADAVPESNPKLTPSLLHGAGFQLLHGTEGALLHFHATPGDRLKNASRGEALEFETTFDGPSTVTRYVLTASGESRINLWTRAFEIAHGEMRRAFGLPGRSREILCLWPTFDRKGFRETAEECAARTARDGFTGACIDVVWDNIEFHGGKKNMNVWDYTIADGYGGEKGLKALVDACRKEKLLVIPWVPAGHLVDSSPIWKDHPDWLLGRSPSTTKDGHGPVFGSLATGFHDHFRDRVAGAIRAYAFDGVWMDTHLAYAQQVQSPGHGAKLVAIYREFVKAGAKHFIVEGDASALGSYGIGIDESWEKIPEPDLYYDSTMLGWANDPRVFLDHFRRYVAAGAAWVIAWDFLYSPKLKSDAFDAARREVRDVLADYRKVKDRMVHRFVHDDGSGYTWTNDRDAARIVWLLKDAPLPDGRRGEGGKVYVIEK